MAQEEGRLLGHNFIGTEHLLLGLVSEGEGVAARVLQSLGVSLEAVRAKVAETTDTAGYSPTGSPPFTPRAKQVLELSLREALNLGHNHIGTEHLLLGLVREGEGVAAQVLLDLGLELSEVREKVVEVLSAPVPAEEALLHAAEPPRCPRCSASLAETAAYRILEIPDHQGGETLAMTFAYCRSCGTALGTAS